ncbi:hypothetical protein ACFLUO_02820 [Chloroflexota bacterium]
MSIAVQKSFFGQDVYLANTRQKLAELYYKDPGIADSEKRVILEFWKAYDGLCEILEDKLPQFTSWFFKATSNETITRCLRSLKEDETIKLAPEKAQQRKEREEQHRKYWINNRRINGGQ